MTATISPGDIVEEDDLLSDLDAPHIQSWLRSIDAILLLGGGVPLSPSEPPLYVQRRCDVVANIMDKLDATHQHQLPSVVCLSAGTAHVPQYITPHNGLPLWESTASAAYLMRHAEHPVPEGRVFAETASYDTISNAFFARTTFTDITGWRRILVVTNEFHVRRSKAIFDWIFRVPPSDVVGAAAAATKTKTTTTTTTTTTTPYDYELYYLSCDNVGLSEEALESRRAHEARGERSVRELAEEYASLKGVWEFLTEKHDFYAANRLVRTAMNEGRAGDDNNLLKLSYGKSSTGGTKAIEYRDGHIVLSVGTVFVVAFSVAVAVAGMILSSRNRGGRRVLRRNMFRLFHKRQINDDARHQKDNHYL